MYKNNHLSLASESVLQSVTSNHFDIHLKTIVEPTIIYTFVHRLILILMRCLSALEVRGRVDGQIPLDFKLFHYEQKVISLFVCLFNRTLVKAVLFIQCITFSSGYL